MWENLPVLLDRIKKANGPMLRRLHYFPDSEKSRIFDALQYNQLADQLVADHVPDSGEWLDRAINFIAA